MKKLLVISFSPIDRDPRVMRQLRALSAHYSVSVAGYRDLAAQASGETPASTEEFVTLRTALPLRLPEWLKQLMRAVFGQLVETFHPRKVIPTVMLLVGAYERYYWSQGQVKVLLESMRGKQFDLVVVNDVSALPVGLKIAAGAPVVLDAHEYAPLEFEDLWRWRLLFGRYTNYLCRTYLPRVSAMVTVSRGVANEYRRVFGVEAEIIRNAPEFQALEPTPVDDGCIRMVHHGGANRSRNLEAMIDAMAHLDERYTLDLVLISDAAYLEELKERAGPCQNIRFVDPVPMPEICKMLNQYDLGLVFIPPVNFNYANCLPNKFFEYVQGRIAIASGPTPEMAELIEEHGLGVVSDSFSASDIASAIRRLSADDLRAAKSATHRIANEISFERDAARLVEIVDAQLEGSAA